MKKLTAIATVCATVISTAVFAATPVFKPKHWVYFGNKNISTMESWQNTFVMNSVSDTAFVGLLQGLPAGSLQIMTLKKGATQWVDTGFPTSLNTSSKFSLALEPHNAHATPYVAFTPSLSSGTAVGSVSVYYFNGKSWVPTQGNNFLPQLGVINEALTVSNQGTPYLLTEQLCGTVQEVRYSVFEYNGKKWSLVGNSFTGHEQDPGNIFVVTDAKNKMLYVARQSGVVGGGKIEVSELVGNTWKIISNNNPTPAYYNNGFSFAINNTNGALYLAYTGNGVNEMPHVIKFDAKQNQWEPVGKFVSPYQNRYNLAGICSLVISHDEPYIAFVGSNSKGYSVPYVMQLSLNNTQWDSVGAPISASQVSYLSLVVSNNNPYVSYQEMGTYYPEAKTLVN